MRAAVIKSHQASVARNFSSISFVAFSASFTSATCRLCRLPPNRRNASLASPKNSSAVALRISSPLRPQAWCDSMTRGSVPDPDKSQSPWRKFLSKYDLRRSPQQNYESTTTRALIAPPSRSYPPHTNNEQPPAVATTSPRPPNFLPPVPVFLPASSTTSAQVRRHPAVARKPSHAIAPIPPQSRATCHDAVCSKR